MGKVTLDLSQRTVGKWGLLWNRLTPTRRASRTSLAIAIESSRGPAKVLVTKERLLLKFDGKEDRINIYYSDAYARCLWKAGVTEIELPANTQPKTVKMILNILSERRISDLSDFGMQVLSPEGFSYSNSIMPIRWKKLFNEITPAFRNRRVEDITSDAALYLSIIGAFGGGGFGAYQAYTHFREIIPTLLTPHPDSSWRTLLTIGGIFVGGALGAGIGYFLPTLIGRSIGRIYHVLRFAGDYDEIRNLYNAEHQLDVERIINVIRRNHSNQLRELLIKHLDYNIILYLQSQGFDFHDLEIAQHPECPHAKLVEFLTRENGSDIEVRRAACARLGETLNQNEIMLIKDKTKVDVVEYLLNMPSVPISVLREIFLSEKRLMDDEGWNDKIREKDVQAIYKRLYEKVKTVLTADDLTLLCTDKVPAGKDVLSLVIEHPLLPREELLKIAAKCIPEGDKSLAMLDKRGGIELAEVREIYLERKKQIVDGYYRKDVNQSVLFIVQHSRCPRDVLLDVLQNTVDEKLWQVTFDRIKISLTEDELIPILHKCFQKESLAIQIRQHPQCRRRLLIRLAAYGLHYPQSLAAYEQLGETLSEDELIQILVGSEADQAQTFGIFSDAGGNGCNFNRLIEHKNCGKELLFAIVWLHRENRGRDLKGVYEKLAPYLLTSDLFLLASISVLNGRFIINHPQIDRNVLIVLLENKALNEETRMEICSHRLANHDVWLHVLSQSQMYFESVLVAFDRVASQLSMSEIDQITNKASSLSGSYNGKLAREILIKLIKHPSISPMSLAKIIVNNDMFPRTFKIVDSPEEGHFEQQSVDDYYDPYGQASSHYEDVWCVDVAEKSHQEYSSEDTSKIKKIYSGRDPRFISLLLEEIRKHDPRLRDQLLGII